MRPRVLDAQLVSAKAMRVKLLVCPAFQENFKMLQVKLCVKRALKIRRVKKRIRPNAIPVVWVPSQSQVVLNVHCVTRVKPALV